MSLIQKCPYFRSVGFHCRYIHVDKVQSFLKTLQIKTFMEVVENELSVSM